MSADDPLLAEIAGIDVRVAEAIARRVELTLALRQSEAPAGGRVLSDQGLRELHRFVLDLTRREAARAENRRRSGAGSSPAEMPPGVRGLPSGRSHGPAGADAGEATSA